jgi:hypothetical protein
MAHQGVAFLSGLRRFENQPHPYVLGTGAAQAELIGEVAAQSASDEEQSLAVLDWWLELAMRAGELRWAPPGELVRLEAAREQDHMSPGATELALQLALAKGRHRAKRAQTEKVKAFELFLIERELVR